MFSGGLVKLHHLGGEYLRWLEADLKAARAAGKKWIIAGGHRPLAPWWQSTRNGADEVRSRYQDMNESEFFSTDFDWNFFCRCYKNLWNLWGFESFYSSQQTCSCTWAKIRLRHSGMIELLEFLGRFPWGWMVCHFSHTWLWQWIWKLRQIMYLKAQSVIFQRTEETFRRGLCYHIFRTWACCAAGFVATSPEEVWGWPLLRGPCSQAWCKSAFKFDSCFRGLNGCELWAMCLEACHILIWVIFDDIFRRMLRNNQLPSIPKPSSQRRYWRDPPSADVNASRREYKAGACGPIWRVWKKRTWKVS